MTNPANEKPPWDDERANALVGARVLIGITYVDPSGDTTVQVFGEVISAHPRNGIEIRLEGKRSGEIFRLPPHVNAFQKARPGEYRLHSTNEVVIDPDYTAVWTVNSPPTKQ